MRLTAKVDYALRAACALAAAEPDSLTSEVVAARESIPQRFLEGILRDLRRGGLVDSRRGPEGGHRLAVPASELSIADIIRVVDGPLATVRNTRPEHLDYTGSSVHLRDVWVALRAAERHILERTTVADVVAGSLPEDVSALLD